MTRFANKAAKAAEANGAPILSSTIQRRWSSTESDITGNYNQEDDLTPIGDSLVSDNNGNTHYLGRSSNFSFTTDAEMLVQSRLRGLKQASLGTNDSPPSHRVSHQNSPHEQAMAEWRDKGVIEDEEEETNPLSGMAIHMGDMHMGVDSANSRERTAPIEIIPPPRIEEAAELAGVGGTKDGGDEDYYIPTKEEKFLLLDRKYKKRIATSTYIRV